MNEPRCHLCGQPAYGRIAYRWADGTEDRRTPPKCRVHADLTLDLWDQVKAKTPEAVDGLTVLVVGP